MSDGGGIGRRRGGTAARINIHRLCLLSQRVAANLLLLVSCTAAGRIG